LPKAAEPNISVFSGFTPFSTPAAGRHYAAFISPSNTAQAAAGARPLFAIFAASMTPFLFAADTPRRRY